MSITELIETLRQAKRLHGDLQVTVATGDEQEMQLHAVHNIIAKTQNGQTALDARTTPYVAS